MEFLYLLEGIRNPVLDTIVSLVTKLGEETIVLAVMCILFWCANKNLAYKLGLVFFSSGLAVQTLKITSQQQSTFQLILNLLKLHQPQAKTE